MRSFDLSPLMRSAIGFDDLYRQTDTIARFDGGEKTYPPYNIEKRDDDRYRIAMAVAGFDPSDLDVTIEDRMLVISGHTGDDGAANDAPDETRYLHRGIATRAFERRFRLAPEIRVEGAGTENGLLTVDLVREIPDEKKPRRIEIKTLRPALEQAPDAKVADAA